MHSMRVPTETHGTGSRPTPTPRASLATVRAVQTADENSHTRKADATAMPCAWRTLASVRSLLTARRAAARRRPSQTTLLAQLLAGFVAIVACAVATGELLRLAERPDGATPLDGQITLWVVDHRTPGATALARLFSLLGSSKVLLPVVASVALWLVWRRRFGLAGLL